MKNRLLRFVALLFVLPFASTAFGADIGALIKQLGSANENERESAIAEIRKLGLTADVALRKAENTEKMEQQQWVLVRRLIGENLIAKGALPALDLKTFAPFGEDKAKDIKGNPDLLLDKDKKIIVLNGEFVLEQGPLEYLVVSKGPDAKLHESILAVLPIPRDICYALLACNYTYAGELGEDGKVNLPKDAGVMISVEFEWEIPHAKMGLPEDPEKKVPAVVGEKKTIRLPMEYFAFNSQTERTMKRAPFAFTGSRFEKDPNTGKMYFMADIEKSVVACRLDPYAILNTPLDTRGVDPQHAAGYGINRHVTPPRQTKCRVIFEPWSGGELTKEDLTDTGEKVGAGEPPAGHPDAKPGSAPPPKEK